MTIISTYSINTSFATSDFVDENDARNKRNEKRKLVKEPPQMRQGERRDSEKLLSDALQLASYKAQRQVILDRDTQTSANRSLEFIHAGLDLVDADLVSESLNSNENKEQAAKSIVVSELIEGKLLQFSDFSDKLHEIESSLVSGYRRADHSEFLENLKTFAFQLNGAKPNTELHTKKNTHVDATDHDLDSMNCSIEFIEGYYEVSSINDDMKQKISDELNVIKSLLNQVVPIGLPVKLPDAVIEAVVLQDIAGNIQKSLGSKPNFNEYKSNAVRRREDEKRGDTLPLATLRSI